MSKCYMLREVLNDHNSGSNKQTVMVGMLYRKDNMLPVLIACGPPGYEGVLSVNELYHDKEGNIHLSRTSQGVLQRGELRLLKETGKIMHDTIDGPVTIVLIEEVDN